MRLLRWLSGNPKREGRATRDQLSNLREAMKRETELIKEAIAAERNDKVNE